MEEEEREAQSAKLQELIRRGTPEDLQEANRLMKIMAGYDTRSKVDYRAKAAEDVGKIQQKARLLEERLEAFKPGDKIVDGDVFSELAAALSSAQPKIQKMCEEESDDHEAVAKLLEINDSIHRTVERYRLLKKGDIEGAKALASGQPVASTSNGSGGAGKSAAQELSLIDFDAEPSGGDAASQSASQGGNSLENDLLGLSLGETSSFGQGGGIALGFGANTSMSLIAMLAESEERMLLTLTTDIPGPALLSSTTQNSTARNPSPQPGSSSFNNFNSFASPAASQSSTPKPPTYTASAFAAPAAQSTASTDPFAALASLSSSSTPAPAPAPAAVSNDDDEWSFSSALPPEAAPAQPKEHRAIVSNTAVRIDMVAVRSLANGPSPAISMQFAFTNNTAQPITELHYQLAVTKVSSEACL